MFLENILITLIDNTLKLKKYKHHIKKAAKMKL